MSDYTELLNSLDVGIVDSDSLDVSGVPDISIIPQPSDDAKRRKFISDHLWRNGIANFPKLPENSSPPILSNEWFYNAAKQAGIAPAVDWLGSEFKAYGKWIEELEKQKRGGGEDPLIPRGLTGGVMGPPAIQNLITNAGLGTLQAGTGLLALPGALVEDPEAVLSELITFIPKEVSKVWTAIRPYAMWTGVGTAVHLAQQGYQEVFESNQKSWKQIVEESQKAWDEIYQSPTDPIFAGMMLYGVLESVGRIGGAVKNARMPKMLENLERDLTIREAAADAEAVYNARQVRDAAKAASDKRFEARQQWISEHGNAPEPMPKDYSNQILMVDPQTGEWLLTPRKASVGERPMGLTSPGKVQRGAPQPGEVQFDPVTGEALLSPRKPSVGDRPIGPATTAATPLMDPLAKNVRLGTRAGARTEVPLPTAKTELPGVPELSGPRTPVQETGLRPFTYKTELPEVPKITRRAAGQRGGQPITASEIYEWMNREAKKAEPVDPPVYNPTSRSGVDWIRGDEVLDRLYEPSKYTAEQVLKDTQGSTGQSPRRAMWLKRFWTRAEKLYQTPTGKMVPKLNYSLMRLHDRYAATFMDMLNDIGLYQQGETPLAKIARKVKGVPKVKTIAEAFEKMPELRQWADLVWDVADKAGVQTRRLNGEWGPLTRRSDWLPDHFLTDEFRKIYLEDTKGLYDAILRAKSAEKLPETFFDRYRLAESSVTDAEAIATINKLFPMNNFKFSKQTQDAIAHAIKNKFARTEGEAAYWIAKYANEQHFYRGGSLQNMRSNFEFPPEAYITDPVMALTRYADTAARTLAQWKVWGRGDQMRQAITGEIGIQQFQMGRKGNRPASRYVDEVKLAEEQIDLFTGTLYQGSRSAFQDLMQVHGELTYASKIGLGFSTVKQFAQPGISFIPDAGYMRWMRAEWKKLNPDQRSMARMMARRSGAIINDPKQKWLGFESISRWLDKFDEFNPNLRVFNWQNRQNDVNSALVSKDFVSDLHRIANESNIPLRRKWAKDKLDRFFDIDASKPLTQSEIWNAMYDYAMRQQLHPNPNLEPVWFNHPKTAWLARLQRFKYRQAQKIVEDLTFEATHGNPMPFLRAAPILFLAYEGLQFIEQTSREFVTGRKQVDTHDPWYLKIAAMASYTGVGGGIGDPLNIPEDTEEQMFAKAAQRVGFLVSPVLFSDLANVGQSLTSGGYQTVRAAAGRGDKSVGEAVSDFGLGLGADIGATFGYMARERFLSDPATVNAANARKGKFKRLAAVALARGDSEAARARIQEYNEYMKSLLMSRPGMDSELKGRLSRLTMADVRKYREQYLKR